MKVLKRDGSLEEQQIEKIQKCIQWACEGLEDVSESQIEVKSALQFYDGISTDEIHETMVKSASDLISVEFPNYSKVAARLRIFQLRKQAYGRFTPPSLRTHIERMVKLGKYDPKLLSDIRPEVLDKLNTHIRHERDLLLHFAGVEQFVGKYLVQDRVTGQIYETPQMSYMCMALALFGNNVAEVLECYEALSLKISSLPTPIMGGLRTPTKQFSSCTLIEAGDSLEEICGATTAIVKYVSQRAGIGIGAGSIRAVGSPIRGGEAFHTGVVPFYKVFQAATKSCSQGGIRGGAATLYYPLWHLEALDLLVLKNNRGVEENRVRHMDYGVQINGFLYRRLLDEGVITLFSPTDVPGLYEAFFSDQKLFEELYTAAENNPNIRCKVVQAQDIFGLLAAERSGTGRLYIQHVDHSNTHSSFKEAIAPVRMSNLCAEITLPTEPLTEDGSGEIALCTLGAINVGEFSEDNLQALKPYCRLLVRMLDKILDIQDYPHPAAYASTMARRPLGIGITNYAYYLAKHGYKYSDPEALGATHRLIEAIQYYLIEASSELAVERGRCPKYNETKYADGILPIDTYKPAVDELCNEPLALDWEALRKKVKTTGLRNSTLSAFMPCETSSQPLNSTNGVEPPRGPISIKQSKHGVLKQVVPGIGEVEYEYLWDIPDTRHTLNLMAVAQKFLDQSISTNTSYDPSTHPHGKLSITRVLADLVYAYRYGLKTLYYHNTRDGYDDVDDDQDCESGACKL